MDTVRKSQSEFDRYIRSRLRIAATYWHRVSNNQVDLDHEDLIQLAIDRLHRWLSRNHSATQLGQLYADRGFRERALKVCGTCLKRAAADQLRRVARRPQGHAEPIDRPGAVLPDRDRGDRQHRYLAEKLYLIGRRLRHPKAPDVAAALDELFDEPRARFTRNELRIRAGLTRAELEQIAAEIMKEGILFPRSEKDLDDETL